MKIEKISVLFIALYFSCLAIFHKFFAKIHVISFIYITDLLLLMLTIISTYVIIKKKKTFLPPYWVYFIAILLWASFELLRGYLLWQNPVYSLRQFAPFLYILFIPIIIALFEDLEDIHILLYAIFISILTASIIHLIFRIEVGHYSSLGIGLLIGIYLYHINFLKNKGILIAAISVIMINFFTTPSRGSWIALFIALLFAFIVSSIMIKEKIWFNQIKVRIIIIFLIISTIGISTFINPDTRARLISTFHLTQNNDLEKIANANAEWRICVWKDMFSDYLKKPILGYGLGYKFFSKTINHYATINYKGITWGAFEGDSNVFIHSYMGLDPHNSHLHILFMLGIIGFILFEGIFILIFRRYITLLPNSSYDKIKLLYLCFMACIVYILVLACFEVVIESPYIVIYLWLFVALLFVTENIQKKLI